MPQLMNRTPQSNQPSDAAFGNPLDLLKTLSDLANSSQQVQQGSADLAQNDRTLQARQQFNAGQQSINPVTNLHNDQIDALRKMLKTVDNTNAEDFVMKNGTDAARQLVDHHDALMQNMTQNGFMGDQSYSSNQAPQSQQGFQEIPPPSQGESGTSNIPSTQGDSTINQINKNVMKQLIELSKNPGNFFTASTKQAQMSNLLNIQRMAAGQPADIAVPLAQAAEINQKIAGAVPLQQKDIVDLNVGTYKAALEANQQAYANSNTEVANLSKTLDILQQGRSTWGKTFGGNTDIMNSLKQVIAAKTLENQKIGKNQKILIDNAPTVAKNSKNESSGFKVIGVR